VIRASALCARPAGRDIYRETEPAMRTGSGRSAFVAAEDLDASLPTGHGACAARMPIALTPSDCCQKQCFGEFGSGQVATEDEVDETRLGGSDLLPQTADSRLRVGARGGW
jgi:hypothetical protein